jgi:hypothetical protein
MVLIYRSILSLSLFLSLILSVKSSSNFIDKLIYGLKDINDKILSEKIDMDMNYMTSIHEFNTSNCEIKEYRPILFRMLRNRTGISEQEYIGSLYFQNLIPISSDSKSGNL